MRISDWSSDVCSSDLLGHAGLRDEHPRLITCDISGYGETGPYAQMKAYDLLVQAESGLASVTGRPEGPGRVGVSVCDIACGMYAYQAVLEALLLRGRTGEGSALDRKSTRLNSSH